MKSGGGQASARVPELKSAWEGICMDRREALAPGTALKLSTRTGYTEYTIRREIGRGGSCMVYDASYTDNLGNYKMVHIKECCPVALPVTRREHGALIVPEEYAAAFEEEKEQMVSAYQKNHELFCLGSLTNAISNAADIYRANGTVYIVSVYLNGRTFAERPGRTLHECTALVLSTARVLEKMHAAGYLYLDLKPENILTLEGSTDLVQLFDFDSVVDQARLLEARRLQDPGRIRASWTRGYAPPEVQAGRVKHIGVQSDLYSLGAVLFSALFHAVPTAFDGEMDAAFDFEHMAYPPECMQDRAKREITEFFHKTLAGYAPDRYRDAGEAVKQLEQILILTDEARPWLRSSRIPSCPAFFGRSAESRALEQMLWKHTGGTVSLWGLGGIGKSTLVRHVIAGHEREWDAVLWLYDQGSIRDLLLDDLAVHIHTVARLREERPEEYLRRKLQVLAHLSDNGRILVVLDDFSPEHLPQLDVFRHTGVTLLLVSRRQLPEGMFPGMELGEMPEQDLADMFARYAHADLDSPERFRCFHEIAERMQRHTLLLELIARQIARSCLDLGTAARLTAEIGLADFPEDSIDYVRDEQAVHDTLMHILDRLMETSGLPEEDRACLKLLSLFDAPGIRADLFRSLADVRSMEGIQRLRDSGWVHAEQQVLSMHPLMQEHVRAWPWDEALQARTDSMMRRMYARLLPEKSRHDRGRVYNAGDPERAYVMRAAEQVLRHTDFVTESAQRLRYRLLMDAPLEDDVDTLRGMLELLEHPEGLDHDSILRLYETAAYYRARLYMPEEAEKILADMKRFLKKHPSAYYQAAYHRAMAVILHNEDDLANLRKCLRHESLAIASARISRHPEARKLLAACLLSRAATLLSTGADVEQAMRHIEEAGPLVETYAEDADDERYQYACIAAMGHAMRGERERAEACLKEADRIAHVYADSDLSLAEHYVEQAAPIRMELGDFPQAEEAVCRAIALCSRHPEAMRYRETVFDAYLFLGRILAMDGQYIRSEAAYAEAEKRVSDSPWSWTLPLCPEEVRTQAERERQEKA